MYHPVLFERELLTASNTKTFRLQNKNFVLWKSVDKWVCMPDKCPHRAAKLSTGKVLLNKIECPYHGWQFNEKGICKKIPQLNETLKIPKACNIEQIPIKVWDGIVWVSLDKGDFQEPAKPFLKNSDYLISDYYLEAPYNYYLQIENLLDPAHLHFVHDGFQGNRKKACPIDISKFYESEKEIYGYFEHKNKDTPDIEIRFIKPSMIDVSIYKKSDKKLIRKNVIYVSPIHHTSCNVLFRDVAIKKELIPQGDPFLKFHGELMINGFTKNFVEDHYQFINTRVIDSIMDQDIEILKSQQENIDNYMNERYVLPAECDRLIVAFRNWCKKYNVSLV